jgi:pimeloyl-ACP methyl ester carboxylesterase
LALVAALLVWGYAPMRARRLAGIQAEFRARTQAAHDAVDARFPQFDRKVNGVNWHYVDEGPREGPVVLFVHGLPEGWYSWRYVLPAIDPQYRLIAVDLKGYGRSDRSDDNYEWHHVAAQLAAFMQDLGVRRYYIVSHDWGTLISSVLVNDYPEPIAGYVRMEVDLLRAANRIQGYLLKPQWVLFRSHWIAQFMMQDAAWFINTVYGARLTTPFRAEDREYLTYEFSRPGVAEKVPLYFQYANWDLETAIDKICANHFAFPVLQLQADKDPAQTQESFAEAPRRCPHVQLEWVKNAGHFDNFDQPAAVAEAINRFLQRTEGAHD